MNVGKLTQAQTALRLTVVYLLCLSSGQQYSPPSPLQPALTSPLPPRIPFTAVHGCSEWNAGRGRTGASRHHRQSVALAGFGDRSLTGHRFEKRVTGTGYPVTVLQPYLKSNHLNSILNKKQLIILTVATSKHFGHVTFYTPDAESG